MTIEGGELDIQLISPTVNLFDLELKVNGKQEVSIVNDAKVLLCNTALFFVSQVEVIHSLIARLMYLL